MFQHHFTRYIYNSLLFKIYNKCFFKTNVKMKNSKSKLSFNYVYFIKKFKFCVQFKNGKLLNVFLIVCIIITNEANYFHLKQ